MNVLVFRSVAITLALSLAYTWLVSTFIGFSASIAKPSWFLALVPDRTVNVFLWSDLAHVFAVLIAAVPVALGVLRLLPLHSLRWALAVGLAPVLLQTVTSLFGEHLPSYQGPWWYQALGYWSLFKVALAPLLLTWLFSRLKPSNQPLHPTTSGGLTAAVVAGERRR
jgi:hypothetical protein